MPSSLTDTSAQTTAKPSRPGREVYFTFGTTSDAYVTTITVPAGSKWTPSPHWHEAYVETFRVVSGRVLLTVDGVSKVVTKSSGELRIEKFAVHEFSRADIHAAAGQGDEGDVIIQEWSHPGDGLKEVFFRTLFSIILDADKFGRLLPIQIMLTSSYCDNYEVYLPGRFRWLVTHCVYAIASALGWHLGLRPVYPAYIPERLRRVARLQDRNGITKSE